MQQSNNNVRRKNQMETNIITIIIYIERVKQCHSNATKQLGCVCAIYEWLKPDTIRADQIISQ